MNLKRRQFLKAAATGAAALGFPAIVRSDSPWAPVPFNLGLGNYKILEVFCHGGLSQWENFWVSHDADGSASESDNNRNWRGVEHFVENLNWLPQEGSPDHSLHCRGFDVDGNGTPVSWGPATAPLWKDRDDIINRTRIAITEHNDEVHGIAGFRTLTGRRFGSPRGASAGTAIQRHYQSVSPDQPIPFSYVLTPKHLRSYWASHATALGQHPGSARPLALQVWDGIGDLLQRTGTTPGADAVFEHLRKQYGALLRFNGTQEVMRSAAYEAHDAASHYLLQADELEALLGGDALAAGQSAPGAHTTGRGPYGDHVNATQRSLEVAAMMLNNGARHVTVFDGGLHSPDTAAFLKDSDTPYDTHTGRDDMDCVEMTSVHLFNLCQSLGAIIGNSSNGGFAGLYAGPGGASPTISLDDTLILIRTEFNRTPSPGVSEPIEPGEFNYAGRNHFGQATAAILIGGPVTDRGIQGGIALSDGNPLSAEATDALSTTDLVAATLLAGGVDALHPDNFLVTDGFSSGINHDGDASADQVRSNLLAKVFGHAPGYSSLFTS